jgi:hypothetical protein
MPSQKKSLGITELIQRIKEDLLDEKAQNTPELFSIDEVNLEINFVISGDISSGFNFSVVTLGSKVSEERIQKVAIKMSPLVSKQQLIDEINKDSSKAKTIIDLSSKKITRGEQ